MTAAARLLLALLLVALTPGAGRAADFVLHTQNMLRFGHGKKTAAQCQAIVDISKNVDIIVLQEVMLPTYPCGAPPGGFAWAGMFGPFGKSSYKEYYGFLYRSSANPQTQVQVSFSGITDVASQATFSRPPQALLFRITVPQRPAYYIWIASFHAIFGKTIQGRRDEARAVEAFFTRLAVTSRTLIGHPLNPPTWGFPVIVAGDWNLPTTDGAFSWANGGNSAPAVAVPNDATSLTRAGAPSSAYDHFAHTKMASNNHGITLTTNYYPASNQLVFWRATVSDHMGVQAQVTVK